jgi:hypothetical protein
MILFNTQKNRIWDEARTWTWAWTWGWARARAKAWAWTWGWAGARVGTLARSRPTALARAN